MQGQRSLSPPFVTSMLRGRMLRAVPGDLALRSSSPQCLSGGTGAYSVTFHSFVLRLDLRCHCGSGSIDLHRDVSSLPGPVIEQMRNNKMSAEPPGARMTDSLGRRGCDCAELSLESALVCRSAAGRCVRSWDLHLYTCMGQGWGRATRNVQRGMGSLA